MATWINRSEVSSAANGTANHEVAFDTPAAGSLLVLIFSSPSPPASTPSGWTHRATAGTNSGLSVYTKIAVGDETDVDITLSHSNWTLQAVVYEFLSGSAWGGFAEVDEASSATGPELTSMTGTPTVFYALGLGVTGTPPVSPNPNVDPPPDGFARDYQAYFAPSGGNDGAGLAVIVAENWDAETSSSVNPTILFVDSTNLGGAAGQSRIAFWVLPAAIEILDTPVVTVSAQSNPTTEGGSDGSITVTWPAVDGADTYTAEIADGHNATDGFSVESLDANSPFVFTGLTSGEYTVAITAVPPEE
jgi:hypothetical protein